MAEAGSQSVHSSAVGVCHVHISQTSAKCIQAHLTTRVGNCTFPIFTKWACCIIVSRIRLATLTLANACSYCCSLSCVKIVIFDRILVHAVATSQYAAQYPHLRWLAESRNQQPTGLVTVSINTTVAVDNVMRQNPLETTATMMLTRAYDGLTLD